MAPAVKTKHVALAMPCGVPHLDMHVRGVLEYAARHGRWVLGVSPESYAVSLSSLRGWPGDGIIAIVDTPADARLVAELRIPAVNISGSLEDAGIPRVTVDNRAIGRLAAEHLLECGFRQFGYYGVRRLWYSLERGDEFRRRIDAASGVCSILLTPHALDRRAVWTDAERPLCQWLASMRPPVGVFACSDYRARMVLSACNRLGLRVPDDVAILGVNDDVFACEFCEPPLSSVSRSAERVGYEAAALLDRLMAGRTPRKSDVLIPPDGVVRRRSTDAVAIDDPEVAAAVRFMREHLSESVSVSRVAENQGISRRWLQDAFQRTVGHSPHQYLRFLRVRRARQILVDCPKMPLAKVARECGFSEAKRLRSAFLRFVGVGPSEYRRRRVKKDIPR